MLAGALSRARLHGVVTNRDLLVADPARRDVPGRTGQHRLLRAHLRRRVERARPTRSRTCCSPPPSRWPSATGRGGGCRPGVPVGWRNVVSQPQRTVLADGESEHVVEWHGGRDGYASTDAGRRVLSAVPGRGRARGRTGSVPGSRWCSGPATRWRSTVRSGPRSCAPYPRFVDPAEAVASGSLLAPMPGTVVGVAVEDGAEVSAGQPVLVLEAMKMQHTDQRADRRGRRRPRRRGAQVAAGRRARVVVSTSSTQAEEENDMSSFTESEERQTLRREVARLASTYGREYFTRQARAGEKTTDLWLAIGKAGLPRHQHPRGVRRRWWRHR